MFDSVSQEERFANLAIGLVGSLPDPDIPSLTSGLLKIAKDQDLNPEQIRRLSEATNQAMFTRMLNDDKNKFDKTSEFPIVDPLAIVKNYYNDDKSVELSKVAEELPEDLSHYYVSPDKLKSKLEKTAALSDDSIREHYRATPVSGLDPDKDYYEKLAFASRVRDELRYQIQSEKIKIAECYDKLASLMMLSHGPDHKSFEKKAYLLYGDSSISFLNALRSQLAMPELIGFKELSEKTASVLINDKTEELVLFKQAMEAAENYVNFKRKFEEFSKVLGER